MTDEELARKLSTWGQDCKKASMMASGDILVSAADRLEKLARDRESLLSALEALNDDDSIPCLKPTDDNWCGCVNCLARDAIQRARQP